MEHKAVEPFDLVRITSLVAIVPQKNPTFWLTSSFLLFFSRMGLILAPVFLWLLYENVAPELENDELYLIGVSIIFVATCLTVFAMTLFWGIQSWILKVSICGYQALIQGKSVDLKSLLLDKTNLVAFVSWRAFRLLCLSCVFLIGAAPGMGFWLLGYVLETVALQFVGGAFACFLGGSAFLVCYSFLPLGDWVLLTTGPAHPIELAKKCWSLSKSHRAQMMVYQLCTLTLAIFGLAFCIIGSAPVLGISLYGWTESLLRLAPPEEEKEPLIKRTALLSSGVEPIPQQDPAVRPAPQNTPFQQAPQSRPASQQHDGNQNPTASLPQFHRDNDLNRSYPKGFFDTQAGPGPSSSKAPPMPAPPPPPRKKR